MNLEEAKPRLEEFASRWYYTRDRKEKIGPLNADDIRAMVKTGLLGLQDMVLEEGSPKWVEIESVSDFSQASFFSAEFYRDLHALHERVIPELDPVACLVHLEQRFRKRRETLREKWRVFQADLKLVFRLENLDPKQHLPELKQAFKMWRDRKVAELADLAKSLPFDDPLRCSITLFGPICAGRREVPYTKSLAWLLDPRREHGFGPVLLNALLRHLAPDRSTVRVTSVESEKDAHGKRLDVFAEGTLIDELEKEVQWCLMIEAKIDAVEADGQLAEYDDWVTKCMPDATVTRVFLTPNGRAAASSEIDWKSISFREVACIFRDALTDLTDTPGYHYLRFYLTGILKDICGWNLPIRAASECVDPYGFVRYLKTVQSSAQKGGVR